VPQPATRSHQGSDRPNDDDDDDGDDDGDDLQTDASAADSDAQQVLLTDDDVKVMTSHTLKYQRTDTVTQ